MQYFDWNLEKNEKLKKERGIGFEDIMLAVEEGHLLDVVEHVNQRKYPGHKLLVVEWNDYVCLVPFVEDKEKIFLKTIIPSRKATKKYLIKK